jgi:hypothetical protein
MNQKVKSLEHFGLVERTSENKCQWVHCTRVRNSARKRRVPTVKPTGEKNRCRKISRGQRSQSPSRHMNRGESASTAESSPGRANRGK